MSLLDAVVGPSMTGVRPPMTTVPGVYAGERPVLLQPHPFTLYKHPERR